MAIFECDCGFYREVDDKNIGKKTKCPDCKKPGIIKRKDVNIPSNSQPQKPETKSFLRDVLLPLVSVAIAAGATFLFYEYNKQITRLETNMEHLQKSVDKFENELAAVKKNLGGSKSQGQPISNVIHNIDNGKGLNQLYLDLRNQVKELEDSISSLSHQNTPNNTSSTNSNVTTPSVQAAATPVKIPVITKAEKNGFIFKVISCIRKSNSIYLKFQVINTHEGENRLKVYGKYTSKKQSFIIDEQGQQYYPDEIKFGAKTDNDIVDQILPSGIPINALYLFRNVNRGVGRISLRLSCYHHDSHKKFSTLLSNIVIQNQ